MNEPSMATTPLSAEEERHVREQDAAFRPGDAVYARPGWLDGLLMERRALLATLDAERAKGIDVERAVRALGTVPTRAIATVAGDRLLAMNASRDAATVEWLTNDIRAIEQEERDRTLAAVRAALAEPAEPVTPGFVGQGGEAE